MTDSVTPLSPDVPILALIELHGRAYFLRSPDGKRMSPASDPKNLLRRVLARHGGYPDFATAATFRPEPDGGGDVDSLTPHPGQPEENVCPERKDILLPNLGQD